MFSKKLRERRKELGLTHKDLAERASLNHVQISTYERGKTMPSELSLRQLAIALGYEEEHFMSYILNTNKHSHNYETLILAEIIEYFQNTPCEKTSNALLRAIRTFRTLNHK